MVYGKTCIIAKPIKKQKKYSRNKLVNWFYKKIFGYEYESVLPPGCNMLMFEDKIIFRDQKTYDMVKNSILE